MQIDEKTLQLAVTTIKTLSMDAVQKANSGHPGTPMGLASITAELWLRYLRYDAKDPSWIGRDRFVLSAGHASMLLYSVLHLAGFDVSAEDLQAFRQWGSKTPGHPEVGHTAGVETTTGPLGQGIANGVGMALAQRMLEARFGEPFVGQRVFVLASDGDLMEGLSGEASSLAGHLGLSNLLCIYDDNRITIEGDTALAYTEDAGKRYEAYGWYVQRIDGHDHGQIRAAIERAMAETGRPSFIVARTHIAHGSPNAQDTSEAHGAPLGEDEIAKTKAALGWAHPKFFVPEEVRALFLARREEMMKEKAAWQQRVDNWRKANSAQAQACDHFMKRAIPTNLLEDLVKALPEKEDATRNLSNALQQVVAKLVPSLVGGSADLAPSTKTLIKGGESVAKGKFSGRNLHFGIREHAMGAICNGMALYGGFVPYGSTFLVFSDYMRSSVRLSAIMNLPCIWIFTHDSLLVGEDGPTHQPIEHLWSLRLIPNLSVVRPADALEVAAAWALAMGRTSAPTAFALSRQKLPNLARDSGFDPKEMLRGVYVLQEATGGKPDVVLVASGSELHLAVEARKTLEEKGKKVRVVSALCLEEFMRQDRAYQERVLPRGIRKASIEAGRTTPWRGFLGEDALTIGIDRFGASAPDKVLAKEFGFTTENIVRSVTAWLG